MPRRGPAVLIGESDFGELPSGLPSALRLRLEESLRVEDGRGARSVDHLFCLMHSPHCARHQPTAAPHGFAGTSTADSVRSARATVRSTPAASPLGPAP